MKLKKNDSGGGGANWMDTYGDMVTLLLCFFVLLYSMSSIDENKWRALVQSFNPDAVVFQQPTPGGENGNTDDIPDPASSEMPFPEDEDQAAREEAQEKVDLALETLYQQIKEYIEQSGKNIQVTKGDGVVYVNFDDTVFFDGEEYTIKPEGEETLKVVCGVLEQAKDSIDEVRVMGHTAQANLDRPNFTTTDRMLASNRATNTTIYIQEHCSLDPARLISEGYGQWRPIVPNDSGEHMARNRRVEMVVSGKDMFNQIGDSIEQYHNMVNGVGSEPESSAEPSSSTAESSALSSSGDGQERG